ncbi:MAG: UDP-forming cellulose synthase catalytic subunit [Synechococcales bacterium]|nr:UDP-forming cellulose synthase catalytic subunit [Synechococcales bacterium]
MMRPLFPKKSLRDGISKSPPRWQQVLQQQWQLGIHWLDDRLTDLLVDVIPAGFRNVLIWLNRFQLVLMILCILWLCYPLIVVRPGTWQQGVIALCLIIVGQIILRLEERRPDDRTSEFLHLLLIALSSLVTFRYFYYRTSYTLNLTHWFDATFSLLLYFAEFYAIATLYLSYFQTLKIKQRKPVDLSTIALDQLPTVDIYIPTYNEDVEIVRKTALAALVLDYPLGKKQVYVLDDGRAEKYRDRRAKLRQMCEELGCQMLTRDNNDHAKAGNINTALTRTTGDLVLILDCDHIPMRSFLQETIGFFSNDRVALVQTPHWFYNPDPFERNLLTGGRIPVGNELFYKVLQKGNDFWNAAFFCGSAAVIRRAYLLEVGGIATETVTEDCHTSLRLHSLGYETIYYDKIMVAGLAPEKFSSYVGQQVRWARGMAQILRLENPLFNRKLKLSTAQRLCYFSATSHFFFGFPRLMYELAPALFLLFGINSVKGLGLETLFYAVPHIILSMQTNHVPYKHVRFSFWNEIYEFAMSFQAGMVTLLALINPKLGTFNVTDKGLTVEKRTFDLDSVRYLVILGTITGSSILAVPFWVLISPQDTQAVLINVIWAVLNLVLVLSACLVAFEQPQLRRSHRLLRQLTVYIHSEGKRWVGQTIDISETGARILLETWPDIPDQVRLEILGDYDMRVLLDAQVLRGGATDRLQSVLTVDFINPQRTQLDDLVLVLYSDVRQWYSQHRPNADRPMDSLRFIATSLARAFQEFRPEIGLKVRKQVSANVQIYCEAWQDRLYWGNLTELGSRDLRLEISGIDAADLGALETPQSLLSLLVTGDSSKTDQSLLVEVEAIELVPLLPGQPNVSRIALELKFPDRLKQQQLPKIRKLLRSLS